MLIKLFTALVALVALIAVLALGLLVAGQLGALQGTAPTDLGVTAGRLKAPAATPNSVSSQAGLHAGHPLASAAKIAPLALRGGDAAATLARLRSLIAATPGAQLVTQQSDYLYARFSTRWLGFVDDAEFWADPVAGVIQVRSASRIGRKDFGANRARIEALRAALAAAP